MKYYLFILNIFFLNSCTNQSGRIQKMTTSDSLTLSIQGSWEGFEGEPIWNFRSDSIFYYSENRSYYYFIHNNDMIVLYKNGPYKFKNIRVINDTLFLKTGNLDAIVLKSKNQNYSKLKDNYFKNHFKDEHFNDVIKNKIKGKWGYEHTDGVFSWVFTNDSIFYLQLNKRYFYLYHDSNIIVLTDENPTIMKDIIVKSDTLSFTTQDNVFIKAHKIK